MLQWNFKQLPLWDADLESRYSEKIMGAFSEDIAKRIQADHFAIERQTYNRPFLACVCGELRWPREVGTRAVAIAKGRM